MANGFLCAAESGSDSISVYSLFNGARERTYLPENAKKPHHLETRGGRIYHADSFSGTVGCVSESGELITAVGAYPTSALLTDSGLFVTCGEANSVWLLDPDTLAAKSCVQTAGFPICAARADKNIVCAALFGCSLELFDSALAKVGTIKLDNMPLCTAYDGNALYAGCVSRGGELLQILDDGKISRVKIKPTGAIRPIGNGKLLLLHVWDDSLTIFDTKTMAPEATAKTARMPDDALFFDGSIYVSCMQSDVIQRFDENGRLVSQFKTLREPRGLALL